MNELQKTILVAPLNWGLGHSTRCIPIIRALEENGFTPILASDGVALKMLQKEFPHLTSVELPSYQIEYAKKGANFKWVILKNSPKMLQAIFSEKKMVKQLIKQYDIKGIISDNRMGVYSRKIPTVFISHQLRVLSGKTTWFSTKFHQYFIKKFDECWVPDYKYRPNLTGKLGHLKNSNLNLVYLGPLSRFEKQDLPIKYSLMVLLSGPEPQRTMLEQKLIEELKDYPEKAIFIRGVLEPEQTKEVKGNITFYNYMTSKELETAMNESELIISRSGYTTVMDLAKLEKMAFFIPTPGQFEQEYLAKRYKYYSMMPYATQENFNLEEVFQIKFYEGFPTVKEQTNWKKLFELFESE